MGRQSSRCFLRRWQWSALAPSLYQQRLASVAEHGRQFAIALVSQGGAALLRRLLLAQVTALPHRKDEAGKDDFTFYQSHRLDHSYSYCVNCAHAEAFHRSSAGIGTVVGFTFYFSR